MTNEVKLKKACKEILSNLTTYELTDIAITHGLFDTLTSIEKLFVKEIMKSMKREDMIDFTLEELGYTEYVKQVENEDKKCC